MNIDFINDYHELFDDWHANKTKAFFTQKMTTYAQNEKEHLPTLLSRKRFKTTLANELKTKRSSGR